MTPAAGSLQELATAVLDELRGAWRFRWFGVAAAWVVCVVGWIVVALLPATYEASARVYVDSRNILRPLLEGLTVAPDVGSALDLVRQELLSRPHLERVARELELDAGNLDAKAHDALMRGLQERIHIQPDDPRARSTGGEGVYRISFQDQDRKLGIQVVRTLVNSFVEDSLGSKRTGQESAQRFLDEQIAERETKLAEAEHRLSEFKKRNVGSMPDQRGDYFARLQQEQIGLEQTRNALSVAESRLDEVNRQLSGEEPFLFGFDSQQQGGENKSSDLTFRIADLEKKLDELLLRYTEKHPEVIATRGTLEELRKRRDEELARLRSGKKGSGSLASSLKANPIYQNLQLEQKRTEVQIAELRAEFAQRSGRVGELRRLVNTVPEVEAELARLNRDYEVVRAQYLELVNRRQTASLSEDADRTGTVKFEVIDPPAADFKPVSPNRPLLLTGVFLLALGAGAVLAYILNHVRPVFLNARALGAMTGLPVIGIVSLMNRDAGRERARQDIRRFAGVTAMLVVAFVCALAFLDSGAQLLQSLLHTRT